MVDPTTTPTFTDPPVSGVGVVRGIGEVSWTGVVGAVVWSMAARVEDPAVAVVVRCGVVVWGTIVLVVALEVRGRLVEVVDCWVVEAVVVGD